MPVFLPVADAADNFQNLILDKEWIMVNLIGLIGVIFLVLGLPGLYIPVVDKIYKLGFIGMIVAIIGLVLYAGIQYYETLLWPAAAHLHPELLAVDGALVSGNNAVVAGLVTSGAILGIGYILFGISLLKTKAFHKLPVWFLIVGRLVFGYGIVFPLRTSGLILVVAGTIWLAVKLLKNDQ